MKHEDRQRFDKPQGDRAMEFREAFSRSQTGDQAGLTRMHDFASMGSKEAETVLLEEINRQWLQSPSATFKQVFDRVAAAQPLLHEAYLNGNGKKPY